jgi:HD-like signal output (HDOD) protein
MVLKLIEIDERINNAELLNLVSNLRHLPTLPKIYSELTGLIENNASVEEISLKLEEDPAIATNVLKLANSAFYNAKTGSIRQAIMYIGLNNVKNIILTNAVFDNNSLDPEFRDIHWRHVNYANKILNALYIEVLGKKLNNNISAVGLLHDVGNIVLMCNFPQLLRDILDQATDREIFLIEKQQIGFSHEELGGHLLDLWGLPMPVIEVALYHHDPLNKSIVNRELIMSMHIADYYAWKIVGASDASLTLNALVFPEMGIPKSIFDTFYEQFKKRDMG